MSSSAGWYPDPGGQPGLFRYWTGSAWTAAVTPNPQATPPPTEAGGGAQGHGQQGAPFSGYGQGTGYAQGGAGYGQGGPGYPQGGTAPRKRATGWWIAGGAALVAVVLAVWFITQNAGGVLPGPNPTTAGGGTASANICPAVDESSTPTVPTQANDGRVHGGKISYPLLGSPWSEVGGDNRVPFGRDVASQIVVQEEDYDGNGHSWVSSVLVGELVAGDGFFSPKEGSEIVMKCVVGTFYSDAVVTRKDVASKQMRVDGHDSWYLESHLTFDIPGLKTKGETAIVVIVDTGADSSSLYYASIPDTADPQLMSDARRLVGELTVQG